MSQKLTSEKNMSSRALNKGLFRDMYFRPSDWLTLPTVSDSEQKVVGLYAVFDSPQANYISFIAAGAYTIDWGDGTTENYASGATASHQYDYARLDSGTLSTRGYRQAIITITPQAGQNLTSLDFTARHPVFSAVTINNWLDVVISGPNLTSIKFGSSPITNINKYLEQVKILSHGNITDTSYMFSQCTSLKIGPVFDTSNVTTSNYMFNGCTSLTEIPRYRLGNSTSMISMFSNCSLLRTIPYLNTSSVTQMFNMFNGCSSLQNIPNFNTATVTNTNSMFRGCSSLTEIPMLDTSNVTDARSMFAGCSSLRKIPKLNLSNITSASGLFKDCTSLKYIPEINLSSVTDLGSTTDLGAFQGCTSLEKVDAIFSATITNTQGAFDNCRSLKVLPAATIASVLQGDSSATSGMFQNCSEIEWIPPTYSFSGANQCSLFFRNCTKLKEIPSNFNMSGHNTLILGTPFTSMYNLERFAGIPPRNNFTLASPKLTLTAVTELLNNLVYYSTARTVTIGACLGTTGENAAITRTSGITSGSTTITQANTTGLSVGMIVTGTGISTARAVTFQDTGDTVTLTNHGLTNGKIVSFSTITTTTGIVIYTRYYVVNATANTFQVSDTLGGAARTLTNNGSGNMLVGTYITAITPNTSVTVDVPATATNVSASLTYRTLDTFIATSKNWTVSG